MQARKQEMIQTDLFPRSYWQCKARPRSLDVTTESWCCMITWRVRISIYKGFRAGVPDLVCVNTQGLSLHVALEVVVGHADAELYVPVHVHDAAVGIVLGVDLPGEDLVGGDGGDHVGGPTVDGDVVTGAELKGSPHVSDNEEGVLYLRQRCGCVVGQPWEEMLGLKGLLKKKLSPADPVPCVGIVEGMTTIRRSEAKVSARLHCRNILEITNGFPQL